jgi:formate dehydrogenase subunit delta
MSAERLVQMANDIGHFFQAEPVREDAVAGIATHIQRFWTPAMRKKITAHLETGGAGLEDLPAEALRSLTVPPG